MQLKVQLGRNQMSKLLLTFFVLFFSFNVYSADYVSCRAQVARATDRLTEVQPFDTMFYKVDFEGDKASLSMNFNLKHFPHDYKPYQVNVEIVRRPSSLSDSLQAIDVNVTLVDVEQKDIVGEGKDTSDSMRTKYLKDQFFNEKKSLVVFDIPSKSFLKATGLENEENSYAWAVTGESAYAKGLIEKDMLTFASVHCEYRNY